MASATVLLDRPVSVVARLRAAYSVERLALVPAGFVPVTLIAATAFGVAGLRTLAAWVLVPVLASVVFVVGHHPGLGRLVVAAVVAGMVATALYDALRFAFIGLGLVGPDPIPHIGEGLGLRPAWVFGYLWRYLGNGAGLAVAFCAVGWRGVRAGVAYGLFVCGGLLVTLVASPYGQEMLFPLTPAAVVMATGGHVVYGAVLGAVAGRWRRLGSG